VDHPPRVKTSLAVDPQPPTRPPLPHVGLARLRGAGPVFDRKSSGCRPALGAGDPGTTYRGPGPGRSGAGGLRGCQCCRYSVIPGRGTANWLGAQRRMPSRSLIRGGSGLIVPSWPGTSAGLRRPADQQPAARGGFVVVVPCAPSGGSVRWIDPPGPARPRPWTSGEPVSTLTGRVLRPGSLFLTAGVERHVTPLRIGTKRALIPRMRGIRGEAAA